MPTIIRIFGDKTLKGLQDKMNYFLEHTPGYLISIKYSTAITPAFETNGTIHNPTLLCSALIRFEATV